MAIRLRRIPGRLRCCPGARRPCRPSLGRTLGQIIPPSIVLVVLADILQGIYRGIVPFVLIQLFGLALLALFPGLATWLPQVIFG